MNYDLLKCAFGRHKFGELLHDDILDRWIKVCRICGAIIEVKAPRDENGDPYDPHDWLRVVNDRDERALDELIKTRLDQSITESKDSTSA